MSDVTQRHQLMTIAVHSFQSGLHILALLHTHVAPRILMGCGRTFRLRPEPAFVAAPVLAVESWSRAF